MAAFSASCFELLLEGGIGALVGHFLVKEGHHPPIGVKGTTAGADRPAQSP